MSDYISKKALLKHLWDWRLQECPVGVCDEETETYKTICECIKAVEEQPTVDEKEIIRKPMERILTRLKDKKQELRTARHNLSVAMYTDAKAYDKARILTQKELVINEAKQIVKEEGGIE